MDKTSKLKLVTAVLISWLTAVSCKIPNVIPDLGSAVGKFFRDISGSIKF